jgi:small subunit ribosomal protein S20
MRVAIRELKSKRNPEEKAAYFRETVRLLDIATRKGVIHKNKAARAKSRLAKALQPK